MTIESQSDQAPNSQEIDTSKIMLEGIAQLSLLRQENPLSEEERRVVEEASYDLITASLRMIANGDDKLTDESRKAHMHVCWQEMAASELILKAESPKVRRLIYTFFSTAREVYKSDIKDRIELLEGDIRRGFAEVTGLMRLTRTGAIDMSPVEQVDHLYYSEDSDAEGSKNLARMWACGLVSPTNETARNDENTIGERAIMGLSLLDYFKLQGDDEGATMVRKAMMSIATGEPLIFS